MRPRANAAYWRAKIASNVARDQRTDRAFADAGWCMVRVWEHESAQLAAERIEQIVASIRETESG
jgi:DNA mismatch endonuclease (patch repair protein)